MAGRAAGHVSDHEPGAVAARVARESYERLVALLAASVHDRSPAWRIGRLTVLVLVGVVAIPRVLFLVPNGDDVEYAHTALERVIANSYVWVSCLVIVYAAAVAWSATTPIVPTEEHRAVPA